MINSRYVCAVGFVLSLGSGSALAQNLLTNGNLDLVQEVEVVPGFFQPKPAGWQNVGTRLITGPYEDEMSSEPWAGPSPTPETTDGFLNNPPYNTNGDYAVFFRPFSGNAVNGAATGHLYQDVPALPGSNYTLTGWAGAESNALMADAQFAIEFFDGGGGLIGGTTLSLLPTLFVDNGEAFDYKQYSLNAIAPANAAFVRARASMIEGIPNPIGGGQAFVIDDFTLTVPAPSTALAFLILHAAVLGRGRRRPA